MEMLNNVAATRPAIWNSNPGPFLGQWMGTGHDKHALSASFNGETPYQSTVGPRCRHSSYLWPRWGFLSDIGSAILTPAAHRYRTCRQIGSIGAGHCWGNSSVDASLGQEILAMPDHGNAARQGNRISLGQDCEEVIEVPPSLFA